MQEGCILKIFNNHKQKIFFRLYTAQLPLDNPNNIACFIPLRFFSFVKYCKTLFYVNFIVIIPNVPTVKDLHIRILGNPDWNSTKCMRVYFIIGYFNIKNYVIDDSVTFISADQKEKK